MTAMKFGRETSPGNGGGGTGRLGRAGAATALGGAGVALEQGTDLRGQIVLGEWLGEEGRPGLEQSPRNTSEAKPDMYRIGFPGQRSSTNRPSSRPFIPGILMSVSTRCTEPLCCSIAASASRPCRASMAWYPAQVSIRTARRRTGSSSSTTRTVYPPAGRPFGAG